MAPSRVHPRGRPRPASESALDFKGEEQPWVTSSCGNWKLTGEREATLGAPLMARHREAAASIALAGFGLVVVAAIVGSARQAVLLGPPHARMPWSRAEVDGVFAQRPLALWYGTGMAEAPGTTLTQQSFALNLLQPRVEREARKLQMQFKAARHGSRNLTADDGSVVIVAHPAQAIYKAMQRQAQMNWTISHWNGPCFDYQPRYSHAWQRVANACCTGGWQEGAVTKPCASADTDRERKEPHSTAPLPKDQRQLGGKQPQAEPPELEGDRKEQGSGGDSWSHQAEGGAGTERGHLDSEGDGKWHVSDGFAADVEGKGQWADDGGEIGAGSMPDEEPDLSGGVEITHGQHMGKESGEIPGSQSHGLEHEFPAEGDEGSVDAHMQTDVGKEADAERVHMETEHGDFDNDSRSHEAEGGVGAERGHLGPPTIGAMATVRSVLQRKFRDLRLDGHEFAPVFIPKGHPELATARLPRGERVVILRRQRIRDVANDKSPRLRRGDVRVETQPMSRARAGRVKRRRQKQIPVRAIERARRVVMLEGRLRREQALVGKLREALNLAHSGASWRASRGVEPMAAASGDRSRPQMPQQRIQHARRDSLPRPSKKGAVVPPSGKHETVLQGPRHSHVRGRTRASTTGAQAASRLTRPLSRDPRPSDGRVTWQHQPGVVRNRRVHRRRERVVADSSPPAVRKRLGHAHSLSDSALAAAAGEAAAPRMYESGYDLCLWCGSGCMVLLCFV